MRAAFNSLILLVIFLALPLAALGEEARLEAIGGGGTVTVKRAGKVIQLAVGAALQAEDEVVTGRVGGVDIRFEDKTLIRVGANTTYRLEAAAGQGLLHRLLSGIVRVLVPKSESKAAPVKFRMNTPEGTIGVRGTEFVVIRGADRTDLKGLEGEVLFGPPGLDPVKDDAGFVRVRGGSASFIVKEANAKPSAPKAFDLDAYLKELKAAKGPFGSLGAREETLRKRSGGVMAGGKSVAPLAAPKGPLPANRHQKVAALPAPSEKMSDNERLFFVAGKGDVAAVAKLLDAGANPNYLAEEYNLTVLQAAVLSEQKPAVELLLSRGALVNAKNKDGHTALMLLAMDSGNEAMAILLLDRKASILVKEAGGWTAAALAREKAKKDPKYRDIAGILSEAEEEALAGLPPQVAE